MWCPWADRGHVWAGCERRSSAAIPMPSGGWTHGRSAGPAWLGVWLLLWALWCPIPAHSQNRVVLPTATDLPQALAQALALGPWW